MIPTRLNLRIGSFKPEEIGWSCSFRYWDTDLGTQSKSNYVIECSKILKWKVKFNLQDPPQKSLLHCQGTPPPPTQTVQTSLITSVLNSMQFIHSQLQLKVQIVLVGLYTICSSQGTFTLHVSTSNFSTFPIWCVQDVKVGQVWLRSSWDGIIN